MGNFEQETIRRVLAGDVDAYRDLMDRHFPAVLRMTLRLTGSVEDAEEAAQEAFLRAYNKLPQFREQAGFGTWVYRIGMNCALNLVERRGRDPGWNAAPVETIEFAGRQPTPEAVLLAEESTREQDRLLRCLTPMERTAFVLRHFEEQPVSEIAAALGISTNTARQTIFRAVSKLRRALAPQQTGSNGSFSATQLVRE